VNKTGLDPNNNTVYVLPEDYLEPPPTNLPDIKSQVNTTSFVYISSSILDQQRLKEEARV
jgi:hypothetical protein